MRISSSGYFALLFLVSSSLACGAKDATKATLPANGQGAPAIGVHAEVPRTKLDGDLMRATGELRAKLEATLSAPASGTIVKVRVAVGQRVKKDEVLMELDTSNIVIQRDQAVAAQRMAAAAKKTAETELDRARKLAEGGSAPTSLLDRAQAQFDSADAGVAQADAALRSVEELIRDHAVRAPFAGVVTKRFKNLGDYVAMMPPTALVSLVDVENLEVKVSIPEALALQIREGQKLHGRTIPQSMEFEAQVSAIGAVVDSTSRSIEVLADIKTSKGGPVLRPGSLAEIELSSSNADGLFIPSTAVVKDEEGQFVWVASKEIATRQRVKVEPATPRFVRVLQGVDAEALVIADPTGLTEGAHIRVATLEVSQAN